jgi:hypothetical protein
MTSDSWSKERSTEKSNAGSKLDGKTTRPCLLTMNDSIWHLARDVEELDPYLFEGLDG